MFSAPDEGSFVAASDHASRVDAAFTTILTIALAAVAAVVVVLTIAVVRRRGTRAAVPSSDRPGLQLVATATALGAVLITFVTGWPPYLAHETAPIRSPEIKVIARAWSWEFIYPNGVSDRALHLPVDTPMRLKMISVDYLHALHVPALRIDKEVVPGRYTRTWVAAHTPGTYRIRCGKHCGMGSPSMKSRVVVHEAGGYDDYLAKKEAEIRPPGAMGMAVYVERGCATCHSVDGSKNTGPTFKGLFGRRETLADGSVVEVDADYLRESIIDPKAKIVSGYQPVMQSYEEILKDNDIKAFIDYVKTLE
jgi:cytochrome c oxidase subunit 2